MKAEPKFSPSTEMKVRDMDIKRKEEMKYTMYDSLLDRIVTALPYLTATIYGTAELLRARKLCSVSFRC